MEKTEKNVQNGKEMSGRMHEKNCRSSDRNNGQERQTSKKNN